MRLNAIVGNGDKSNRAEYDFYATPFSITRAILDREALEGTTLEPAAGEGHIVKVLREFYPDMEIVATDLIPRTNTFGIDVKGGVDFLKYEGRHFDNVVTNPPFNCGTAFIEKALEVAEKKIIIFGKIQLLTGLKRRELFLRTPPSAVYILARRPHLLRNGTEEIHASLMDFAWYVWDKSFEGEPRVRWI